MKRTPCLLCKGGRFRRLVRVRSSHVLLHNLGGKYGEEVQFAVCKGCGLVCQFPMLTDADCEELYSGTYRDSGLCDREIAFEQARSAVVVEWLDRYLGTTGRGRRVLDVGCGSGTLLLPFKQRGWEVTGIEPLEAWSALARERFGLAVTTGFYSAQSFPDRAFDLILMSHVIEHLPDPQPILAATKSHLALGGRLFIGTPNVVLPKLTPSIGSFNAAHVRLYSLNTLSRLLAGSGFRASASINLWPSYGLAVLAEPSEGAAPMMTADDANAVADLYDGLLQRKSGIHPDGATPLSRNLAALHPGRPDLVQLLCGHIEFRPYRLVAQPGDPTLALVEETSAGARSMEIEPDESGIAALMRSAFARGRIVVTGRGWWKTAVIALAHLREGQRMIIREPDPRIFKLAFMARDLSHVLSSSRVAVEIGSGPAQKYRQGPEPVGECHAVIRDGRPNSLNPVPVLSGEV